jgi:hypothetical protein
MSIPPSWHPPSILLFAIGAVVLGAYWWGACRFHQAQWVECLRKKTLQLHNYGRLAWLSPRERH